MGVPGFFLWLWKKYKKEHFVLNLKDIKEDFKTKWLCLDANCLLHPKCFEVLAENPNYTNTGVLENKMMNKCIEYIEKLYSDIRPTEGLYIAIDGVAPVAKIKQQRSRRFKSVQDREMFDRLKKKHGVEITRFWNNSAITPGTNFMSKLTSKLIGWAKKQSYPIIFSTAQTPMEGEHKILDFIRKREKDNKNGPYTIYGLDADLIFLGMATQRKDIYLLREANQLDRTKNEEVLNIVDLEKMKDCLVSEIRGSLTEDEDNSCKLSDQEIINEFIFMGYFLGNDFLPHMVTLDIYTNGIPDLIKNWVECYQEKYQTIVKIENKKVVLNQEMLLLFIKKLADKEEEILADLPNKKHYKRPLSSDPYEKAKQIVETLRFRVKDPIKIGEDDFESYSKRYYQHYFYDDSLETRIEVAFHFIKTILWSTKYYFEGCPSWDYYYPFSFAPFIKDLVEALKAMDLNKIKFYLGKPLKPFEQLLTVLPPQSAYLLPRPLQTLFKDKKSELLHLYPLSFQQDFLHKRQYWQGIPLLPHLDIKLITDTYKKYEKRLKEDDKKMCNVKKEIYLNFKLIQ